MAAKAGVQETWDDLDRLTALDGLERPRCLPEPTETPAKRAALQVLELVREIVGCPDLTGPQAAGLLYASGLVPLPPEPAEHRHRRLRREAFAGAEWRRMVAAPGFQALIRAAGPG